jgi:ComF family protein
VCDGCAPDTPHRLAAPAGIGALWVLAGYDAPLGAALRRAKYRPDRVVALALARRLAEALAPIGRPDAVVPVPTPWTRRMSRGFSLPHLLAHAVSERLGAPLVEALGVAPGRSQASLRADARRENLARRIATLSAVPGRVLLVDDVVTTGATAQACARALLAEATREVWLAAVCAAREDG